MTPRLATFSVFMINGAMIGTWVAHIPWLQDHLGISKATLGLCLLCMAAGALISMPVTGHVLDRRPSAAVTRASALVFCLMLPLPLLATSPYMLAGILFVFGAVNGVMDVAMNAHGVALERELPKPIMSSLHGGWSLGGFAAAGTVVIAATAGVDPRVESLAVGVALWVAALWVTRRLGSASAHSKSATGFALPSRAVILIGGLCFLAMMVEGGIADWSGIYLRHDIGASTAAAAMAFTGFSLGMAVARLSGDSSTSASAPGGCCVSAWRWSRSRSARYCSSARSCPPSSALRSAGSGLRMPCRCCSALQAGSSRRARRSPRRSRSATRASSSGRR